ncbi:catabolic L-serine/threonine dehydratase [Cladophialophora chaetospira]|uniref:L-serine ammonia-lyase n=1 Tax=Cladophialophora chaetospira TaxID=386627 RepID=A0AA38XJN2_9EURO|nr:catabolic L-serine/threonine dehydratase [Cladophialophora chaetospira]
MPHIESPWIETPLVESTVLSKIAGCRIFLKLENLQPSGSFKSRGIGNSVLKSVRDQESTPSDDRPLHFYSSSAGNAGMACVTAATSLGHASSVVVPLSTDEATITKLRAAGASEVIPHGESWFFADQFLRETVIPAAEARGEKGIYIHPFDNPAVWEGASTMVEEIQRQMPGGDKPDAIVCSVGGGGLFSGIMIGLDRAAWDKDVKVLAVETKGADSLAQSLEKKELVTLPAITSVAASLGAIRVAKNAFEQAQRPNVRSVVLEDAEACAACWRFLDDERILVEPACGVSIALAYDGRLKKYLKDLGPESKVVLVVCGGSKISLELLNKYKEKYQVRSEELANVYA